MNVMVLHFYTGFWQGHDLGRFEVVIGLKTDSLIWQPRQMNVTEPSIVSEHRSLTFVCRVSLSFL